MDTATVPRSCTNWCYCKPTSPSGTVKPTINAATTAPVCVACKKLDGMAAWLINGLATVFFKTLERCSCFYIDTIDDNDPDPDPDPDADVSFIYKNNANLQKHGTEEEEEVEEEGAVSLKNIGTMNIKIDA